MVKLAADISMLWAELPYLDRFEAAAEAGFEGVVVPAPYDMPAKDTQRALLRTGLSLVMIAAPPPNYTGGARGFAAVPGAEQRFAHDLRRTLRYCDALRVPRLRLLCGPASGPEADATLRMNLAAAVDQVPVGMQLLIGAEPAADAFMASDSQAGNVVRSIGDDRIKLDLRVSLSEAANALHARPCKGHASLIGHVTLCDLPANLAAPVGSDVFKSIVNSLENINYSDWVTASYKPSGRTEDSLSWMKSGR